MSGESNKMINHDQEDRKLQSRSAFLVLLCDNVAIVVPLQMSDSSAVLVMQQQFCQTAQVRRSLATFLQNSVMLRAKSLLE